MPRSIASWEGSEAVAMAPGEHGQLSPEGTCTGIRCRNPPSARPGLDVAWEDIGGLALTPALENASSPHTDEGADASRRHVTPDASLLCKPPPPKRVWLGVTSSISTSWKARAAPLPSPFHEESCPGVLGAALKLGASQSHLGLGHRKALPWDRETPPAPPSSGDLRRVWPSVMLTTRGTFLRVAGLVLGSPPQAVSPSIVRLGVLALAV